MSNKPLSYTDHDRNIAALRYVYPVISRRAGGVSVGVNLNPNNACNWRCIYCQVPELTRGAAPPVDLNVLEQELRDFLNELLHGSFMQERVPEGARRINDIALSGNGEPTSSPQFAQVIQVIARVRREAGVSDKVKTVLITNGSLFHRDDVRQGVCEMAMLNGEVWFKLDRASEAEMQRINDTRTSMSKVRDNLAAAAALCPTWLQTCWFALDGKPPSQKDERDYIEFVSAMLRDGIKLQGVLLYGLARPSLQSEAHRLSALPAAELQAFAARIGKLGLSVRISI